MGCQLGHMQPENRIFWGGSFQFQANKEARDKNGRQKRGKITPPGMGDNYTFWGVTL